MLVYIIYYKCVNNKELLKSLHYWKQFEYILTFNILMIVIIISNFIGTTRPVQLSPLVEIYLKSAVSQHSPE